MGRKVFISYKYNDNSVLPLDTVPYYEITKVRDYVTKLQNILAHDGIHINKGENDGESLADFKDETIQSKLSDKIFDSSVTIVLLSPNMKELTLLERDQWMPWEIAYSIKNKTRSNNSSKRNAILLVALPDRNGRYDYVNTAGFMFNIIENNRHNLVYRYPSRYFNPASKSYCLLCHWDQFLRNINLWIEAAVEIKEHAVHYQINTKF